jgi:hypothetical protein
MRWFRCSTSTDANHRRQKPLMRCTAVFIAQLGTPGHADWLMVVYRSFVLSRAPSHSVTVSYSTAPKQIRDPVTQPNRTSRSYVRCVIGTEIATELYSWNMSHGWDWAQAGQSGIRFPTEAGMFSLTITTSTPSRHRRLSFFGNKMTGDWGRPFIWIQHRWSFTSIATIRLHNVAITHGESFTTSKVRKECLLDTRQVCENEKQTWSSSDNSRIMTSQTQHLATLS